MQEDDNDNPEGISAPPPSSGKSAAASGPTGLSAGDIKKLRSRKTKKVFDFSVIDEIEEERKRLAAEEKRRQEEARKKRLKKIGWTVGGIAFFILILIVACQPRKGTIKYGICKVFTELNIEYPMTLRISQVREQSDFVRVYFTHTDSFGQFRSSEMECYYKINIADPARQWMQNIIAQSAIGDDGLPLPEPGISAQDWANAAGIPPQALLAFLDGSLAELPNPGDIEKLAALVGLPPPQGILALDRAYLNSIAIKSPKIINFNKSIPLLMEQPPDLTLPSRYPQSLQELYIE